MSMSSFHRKPNRLPIPEIYKSNNAFFVTICVKDRKCVFVAEGLSLHNIHNQQNEYNGDIKPPLLYNKNNRNIKSPLPINFFGKIVEQTWLNLPEVFENIVLNEFVIMPNHFHGIIIFLDTPIKKSNVKKANLSDIIGYFKAYSQKIIRENIAVGLSLYNKNNGDIKSPLHSFNFYKIWQKSFYDRVIRNEKEFMAYQEYIQNNPLKWKLDLLNPKNNDKFEKWVNRNKIKKIKKFKNGVYILNNNNKTAN